MSRDQLELLADPVLMARHRTFRLNREVSLDAGRAWCPSPDCDTVCQVGSGSTKSQLARDRPRAGRGVAVRCPTCNTHFCSLCLCSWPHPGIACKQNSPWQNSAFPLEKASEPNLEAAEVKQCPTCCVPIEKAGGCARMFCNMCDKIFCWHCTTPFNKVTVLLHFRSGRCPGRTPRMLMMIGDFLVILFVLDALFVSFADETQPGAALQKPSILFRSLIRLLINFFNEMLMILNA